MKKKKGFTLVELLAVIAILAILVILALPNVINRFNEAKKQTFVTEAKKLYTEAGKKFMSSSISGSPVKVINSEDDSKLDMTGKKLQYCIILDNSGNVTSMKVSNGQWVASLNANEQIDDLSIDDIVEGNLEGYNCNGSSTGENNNDNNQVTKPQPLNCTFDNGKTPVKGDEYVNGQYTYRYMQEGTSVPLGKYTLVWKDITTEGWGVLLTDKASTDPVNSSVCTTINGKPVVSMAYMFHDSQSTNMDFSNFNTSNVINMDFMFSSTKADKLDLRSFDTSKTTITSSMFYSSKATTIDLRGIDTSNVTDMRGMFSFSQVKTILGLENFDTRNVTNMYAMFYMAKIGTIDLSSFDTSKVTNMGHMFEFNTNLTTIYASDKFVTDKLENTIALFGASSKLIGGAGTKFDSSKTDKSYARIDGGTSNPGYFTPKTRSENNTSAESRIRNTDMAN